MSYDSRNSPHSSYNSINDLSIQQQRQYDNHYMSNNSSPRTNGHNILNTHENANSHNNSSPLLSAADNEMGSSSTISPEDYLDWTTFEQILEMDEDETEREFSKSIVENFYEQAESTFIEMETAVKNRDLNQLSSLGHFLKGSSAALGLAKVKNSCEKIQNLGANMDESGTMDMNNDDLCLKKIQATIEAVKEEYAISRRYLEHYFNSL